MKHTEKELIDAATDVRERAYAPYSNFKVGAAVETEDGDIYTGCNVESASYGLTVCAERVAIWKGISRGVTKFGRIAVVVDTEELTMRTLSDAFIDRYLDVVGDGAQASVGGYQIESVGIHLFEKISGDYYAILGLPLLPLLEFLRKEGAVAG